MKTLNIITSRRILSSSWVQLLRIEECHETYDNEAEMQPERAVENKSYIIRRTRLHERSLSLYGD